MTAGGVATLVKMPTADDIFGQRIAPAPWLSSRPVLGLVAEVLPTVEDDLAAELLEHVALALADRDDEVKAIRAVLSSDLALSHTQQAENVRLRRRVAGLLDARRLERGPHE